MAHNLKTLRKQFHDAGVFHTDTKLAEMLRERIGECSCVYDPTCGDGALLAVFPDHVKKYGQEINPQYLEDARRNLVNFEGVAGDTLTAPAFEDLKFDAIVANPPFSIAWEPKSDPRFDVAPALAPKGKADYAFILHILSKLTDTGTAVVLCFPGILYRGNAEGKIRQWLVENGFIWRVERLGGGHFVDTAIETALLTIRRQPCSEVEFVDTVEGLSRTVSLKEIAENGFTLSVPAYVQKPEEKRAFSREEEVRMEAEAEEAALISLRKNLSFTAALQKIGAPADADAFARRVIAVAQEFLDDSFHVEAAPGGVFLERSPVNSEVTSVLVGPDTEDPRVKAAKAQSRTLERIADTLDRIALFMQKGANNR